MKRIRRCLWKKKCLQQEKELVFESVTQEDMIRLGWTLYENNKK